MKVINVIQDNGPPKSRTRFRESHCDDLLAITILNDQCDVKCILFDTGSSANIFYKENFMQMDIPWSKVIP